MTPNLKKKDNGVVLLGVVYLKEIERGKGVRWGGVGVVERVAVSYHQILFSTERYGRAAGWRMRRGVLKAFIFSFFL